MKDSFQIHDAFLNACRKEKQQVTVFLVNGVKLQGVVSAFDSFAVLLRRSAQTQLVYKHSIATIVPAGSIDIFGKNIEDSAMSYEGDLQIA
ncbi:MAG: RNA chaperone Hfq [Alphaproteobacteria bacterium]|nr:MAG: RNA chaperone Hfq [Alphaproteobacteria bacterium]TAF40299.1 MAG: RNA chaperone Hfq [Alphaproteobacteria bacterium]TAF75286.1 MAG: RNA chaperone Hfq [Alphaproteobacteria bacterium]